VMDFISALNEAARPGELCWWNGGGGQWRSS